MCSKAHTINHSDPRWKFQKFQNKLMTDRIIPIFYNHFAIFVFRLVSFTKDAGLRDKKTKVPSNQNILLLEMNSMES